MVTIIYEPRLIPASGEPPKSIKEFIGLIVSGNDKVSIARMKSPPGWREPGQNPDFDEYTLVLEGNLVIETRESMYIVGKDQAAYVPKNEWVRYSTPEGASYIAVCIPSFSPDAVHRDIEDIPATKDEKKGVINTQDLKSIAENSNIIYTTYGVNEFDLIRDLWEGLIKYLIEQTKDRSPPIRWPSFETRKTKFMRKNKEREISVIIASNAISGTHIGYCVSSAAYNEYAEIESIFVREEFRGQGIGSELIKRSLDWIKMIGASSIGVAVTVMNSRAIAFYAKHGFFMRQYLLEKTE